MRQKVPMPPVYRLISKKPNVMHEKMASPKRVPTTSRRL